MSQWTDDQLKAAFELSKRKVEALKLFRATQQQAEILKCTAREMLVKGGNRSGKSTICAVRMASILLNQPVYTEDGEEIYCRLPWQNGYKLKCWVVGLGENHIGQTIYRLLFEPGLFKIIRDEKSGEWRAFRPWDEVDANRESEARPSPPLIPKRYIKPKEGSTDGFVWTNRGAKVFDKVEFWNPIPKRDGKRETISELYAFTSSGDVKAGDPVDEIWIDEKIKYPSHYPEWQARLIDRRGRIAWSSWPAIDNNALLELKKAAEKSEENGDNLARMFTLRMSGNKHLDKQSRLDAVASWRTDADKRARDDGEFVTDTLRLYPDFKPEYHCAIIHEVSELGINPDKLSSILSQRGGVPPTDWTVDLILDPGTKNPAVLLCAVPPPHIGDYLVPFKEISQSYIAADEVARLSDLALTGRMARRFIIDNHAGRQTPMGFNNTVMGNYSASFQKFGLRSIETGSGFIRGSDNVPGRISTLQSAMLRSSTGLPRLRIVKEGCPKLCEQLETCVKHGVGQFVEDYRHAAKQEIDLVHCLEYWVASHPRWVPPMPPPRKISSAEAEYQQLMKIFRKKEDEDGTLVLGPRSG